MHQRGRRGLRARRARPELRLGFPLRLWSLHPKHLDARGLVALWREALLAKKVLQGRTKGYRHHPQLARFREHPRPLVAINGYLMHVWHEAERRGYHFDKSKIRRAGPGVERIRVPRGQVAYEWSHLKAKVRRRDPAWYRTIRGVKDPSLHALFRVGPGGIASWERPARTT